MKKVIAITPELRLILACAETIEIEVDDSSELAVAKDHIAQQQERINALLEQRNRMGTDVQNAATTGNVPMWHPLGSQLSMVAAMRVRLAELERQAAIWRRSVDADQLAQIIRKVDGSHSLGAGALAERIIAELVAILRDAEKAGVGVES